MVGVSSKGREPAGDLIANTTDWGVSVSEPVSRKTAVGRAMWLGGYLTMMLGALLFIPILAGVFFFGGSVENLLEAGIIVAILSVSRILYLQSRKGPKNALQIDYDASEVRLGSLTADGVFIRHKVCPLRSIDRVSVDTSAPDAPALTLSMFSETATIHFARTDAARLADLAARVQTAADEARAAPIRSRIVSRINGFEAGMREIGTRVRSRITSSFA